MNIKDAESTTTYMPLNGFTTSDIGCERGNNIINPVTKLYAPMATWNTRAMISIATPALKF
jgi:hypothetical protein